MCPLSEGLRVYRHLINSRSTEKGGREKGEREKRREMERR